MKKLRLGDYGFLSLIWGVTILVSFIIINSKPFDGGLGLIMFIFGVFGISYIYYNIK